MIRTFRSRDRVEAIEFSDGEQATVLKIIKFTGYPATVDYDAKGDVRAGIIKRPEKLLTVKLGQFVCKDEKGNIDVCDYDDLVKKYEDVTTTETAQQDE